ncbi:DUF6082 family protein [Streptomyces sp. NPDC050418]|uniref:DUF6082 family protein n=1 Tax=Streptomyces sp. NPDC050418 TaxID=3365612 RepID=UPI0037AD7548
MGRLSDRVTRQHLIWSLTGVAVLSVIASTPFLLVAVAPDGQNWGELSDISQTYGALSVLFSGAALLGVIVSLVYQARLSALERAETQRSVHRELLTMSFGDPDLIPCWPPWPQQVTATRWKQLAYINLIYNSWYTDYRLGRSNEEVARTTLANHFRGQLARTYWEMHVEEWREVTRAEGSRRAVRYFHLTKEAYAQAVADRRPAVRASAYLRS